MARYNYQARDAQGQATSGVVAASSLEEAGQILRAEGKFIVKLIPASDKNVAMNDTKSVVRGRIRRSEVIFFVQQMSVMLDTGVSMSDALECLVDQCDNPAFKDVLRDVTTQVQGGGEFSAALNKHPKVFPNLVTSLIRASEVSGTMSAMLDRISGYMTREQQIMRQARGALMYPMFMMLMAITVTVFLLTFVLPRFAKIYASKEAALPAPTRLLIALSNAMTGYWYLWLGGSVIAIVSIIIFSKTDSGRRCFDWLKLNAPICRMLFSRLYLTRACRTMGTMISAGISMLEMVQIVKQVTNNSYYDDLWDEVEDQLTRGAQLSDPLFESVLIPRPIAQMVYSGEKAGRLGHVMERVASFTEVEFEQAVKTTTQFIEPVMIGVMGGIIGFVAISLLLPIFSVGRVMASG